ncbi:murein L,D-transpeptidase catalytic domain family protein [Novosphingobium sp. JCM 18896]|uniref:murein L,D-transpeptidase catalytic domain family protein n=1 Tax=Novosphingobium sp. JCM 18896 TaxID=2989731 RepID=UPI002222ADBE|nr:murein L,D-transpeptidase catalytic domain family protein [Novosphingobium sp. JCM 18896]MCW1429557.1 murein L,D-transpeptidase catalytic domain family protein [Novosphingobium sp. JCM 18896]
MKRRDVIKGGLIGAAALAVPARALADPLGDAFDSAFVPPAAPTAVPTPALTVPAVPEPNPAYERRVLEIAQREVARAGNTVWRRDIAGIADFARPSSLPRFHFANLENGTVRSFLVAHGRGSDPEHDGWLKQFSNVPGSEATSRGGYLTCEWYKGKYGTSIRLVGLDPDNSLALPRAIVVHPAWYVDPSMVSKWGKIGRSEGCFAMAPGDFNEALWHLSGGRLLYADRITLA